MNNYELLISYHSTVVLHGGVSGAIRLLLNDLCTLPECGKTPCCGGDTVDAETTQPDRQQAQPSAIMF